jgi:tetratricopeptide (TPR) repeat protein
MAVKIFFCYAHEDEQLLNKLKTQLTPLRHQHFIEIWHDRDISAGTEWEKEISKHLNTAKIILLLVSPNFMASDYCYSVEMKRALERHERGEAVVIPIILRPVFWQSVLGKLQALPKDAIPMKKWPDLDDAFFDVEEGIRKVIKVLLLNEGEDNFKAHSYLEALTAFEQVIQLDPKNATAYHGMGNALHALNQPEEALSAYEKAIKIDPNYAVAWCGKGNILCDLKRYEEALIGFERSIQLDHKLACGYIGKGNSLRNLNRNQEALTTYEQAIKLAHNDANLHNSKGEILRDLNRNEEALASFEQATQIAPENVHFNTNRIDISYDLRLSAAEAALKQVVERDIARKQMRHELGASQNTGRLSIEQLWYTWSTSGFGVTTGFRVRAASQGLADMNSKIINALTPHLQYRLPHGIYDIDPKEAPICLSLIETEQEHILVNKVYTGYDGYRRPGAFFTHLFC